MSQTNKTAQKLLTMADGLQKEIDAKFASRLENTYKRAREAASMRDEGHRLEKVQAAMAKPVEAKSYPAKKKKPMRGLGFGPLDADPKG